MEKEERICIVLEVYDYTGSRTEYITGTLASINCLAISEQHGQRSFEDIQKVGGDRAAGDSLAYHTEISTCFGYSVIKR